MSAVLVIDLDGVVAHFSAGFAAAARKLGHAIPEGYEPKSWDWEEVLDRKARSAVWKECMRTPNFWLGLPPYADAIPIIHSLYDHSVYFVTSRTQGAGDPTLLQCHQWLDRETNLGYYGSVIVVQRPEDKPAVLKALHAKYAVDDKPETVEAMRAEVPSCRSYLLTRPWNKNVYTAAPRVDSLRDWMLIVRAA